MMSSQQMCEIRIQVESINNFFFLVIVILSITWSTRILMGKLKTEDRNLEHHSKEATWAPASIFCVLPWHRCALMFSYVGVPSAWAKCTFWLLKPFQLNKIWCSYTLISVSPSDIIRAYPGSLTALIQTNS